MLSSQLLRLVFGLLRATKFYVWHRVYEFAQEESITRNSSGLVKICVGKVLNSFEIN